MSAPAEPLKNIWFCSRCRRKLKITIANNSGWATTLSKTHSKTVVFGANFNSAWEWHHFQEAGTVIRAGMVNNIFSYVLACPGGWARKPLMWCPHLPSPSKTCDSVHAVGENSKSLSQITGVERRPYQKLMVKSTLIRHMCNPFSKRWRSMSTLSLNGEGSCQKDLVKSKVDSAHVQPFQ